MLLTLHVLPVRLQLVARTLCFTCILSPLHQGAGDFRLMLGNLCLEEDDNDTGKWQGINNPQGAWGQGLFTGTSDMPREGVSDPLPCSSVYTRLREPGMQCRHCVFSVAAFRNPELLSCMFWQIRISPLPCRECSHRATGGAGL